MTYTIAFGNDHAGVALKQQLMRWAANQGHRVIDLGPGEETPVDYPDMAQPVCLAVLQGRADYGVLICGSGIGMSMAANRYAGIRAALCNHHLMAQLARAHNDANLLVLGQRLTGTDVAQACLDVFLTTPFAGAHHAARVHKLD